MDALPISERTLVLGDFSPKNILVHSGGVILLDFECAPSRSDPTFDLGFFLSHLILKSIHFGRGNLDRARDYALPGRSLRRPGIWKSPGPVPRLGAGSRPRAARAHGGLSPGQGRRQESR